MSARWAATSRWPGRASGAHLANVKGYALANVSVSEFQSWHRAIFQAKRPKLGWFQGFISDPPQSSPPLPARRRRFHDLKLNARIRFSATSETLLRCEICTASPWTPPQNKTLMEIKSCTVWYRSSSLKLDKVNADDSTFCFFSSICIYHSIILTTFFPKWSCNCVISTELLKKTKYYTIFFSTIFFPTGE